MKVAVSSRPPEVGWANVSSFHKPLSQTLAFASPSFLPTESIAIKDDLLAVASAFHVSCVTETRVADRM